MPPRLLPEDLQILLCEPEHGQRRLLRIALERKGVGQVMETDSLEAAFALAPQADAALMSLSSGEEKLLARLRGAGLRGGLVAALNQGSVTGAVAAMKAGAHDVVLKPARPEDVAEKLLAACAVERRQNRQGFRPPPRAGISASGADFCGFLGRSPAMQHIYETICRIAPSHAPIFVTGESGTGKELAAAAIHARSPRQGAPFHALNCGAIPRDLIESEIFGHARGAFTGAHADRPGAAELADGGTLFLDEIGEMDLAFQAKLLRFLQDGKVRRIGEGQERQVDVRIICATNRDPLAEVKAGRLREDLFYRLHVLHLHLPPLRERGDDVILLAQAFLARFAGEEGRPLSRLGPDAWAVLQQRPWRGNVRELQNVMRRVVVLGDGPLVPVHLLHETGAIPEARPPAMPAPTPASLMPAPALPLPGAGQPDILSARIEPFAVTERRIIEEAIATCGGNVVLAATALDLSPSTLYRKRQGWQAQEQMPEAGAPNTDPHAVLQDTVRQDAVRQDTVRPETPPRIRTA